MSRNKSIGRLTPTAIGQLQAEMHKACQKIASQHGVVVDTGGARNLIPGLCSEFTFKVSVPDHEGNSYDPDKEMFELLAESFGLSPDDFGREFNTGNEIFKITGINPKRPKYPISAERVPDGQGFKFAAENVAMLLKNQG